MATGDSPVLEALVELNTVSLARTELDPRSLMLVRIAALVAVDAPTSSNLLHVGPSVDAGLTAEDAEDVLVAVTPIVGAPRAASAAVKMAEALDLAISFAVDQPEWAPSRPLRLAQRSHDAGHRAGCPWRCCVFGVCHHRRVPKFELDRLLAGVREGVLTRDQERSLWLHRVLLAELIEDPEGFSPGFVRTCSDCGRSIRAGA